MAEKTVTKMPVSGEKMGGLDKKKAEITDRLQKRDDNRVADMHRRKEEKDSSAAANENVDFFWEQFTRARAEIETALETSGNVPKAQLVDHFDKQVTSLQKTQKFLSDSTMFLPSYQVQKAQEYITQLQTAIQEKREELIPKKKFGFKSKKKAIEKPNTSDVTDGANLQAAKKKKDIHVDITDCSFSDVKSQTLTKEAEQTKQQDVALARLEDCTVKLYGSPSAVHINNLKNCKVFSGPVSGSIFVDDCYNCVFVMPCQQMRIHSTKETQFYIHVTSRAIIEDCSKVEFAPYNWEYEDLGSHYSVSGLDKSRNNWDDVDDFNWLASDQHSPNWSVLDEKNRVPKWSV